MSPSGDIDDRGWVRVWVWVGGWVRVWVWVWVGGWHSGELSHKQADMQFFRLGMAFISLEMTVYHSENSFSRK